MSEPVKMLVVGVGNMGISHAKAYHKLDGFEIVGLMSRTIKSRTDLPEELSNYPRFEDFGAAMAETRPDAVSINTWPNTHADYALKAFDAGCHVFMEKPIATNIEDAEKVVAAARAADRKLVLGYILRVHPSWMKFIEVGKTLGKPLVMRLNLNQQSSGPAWMWHKNLIDSLIPIVDCGVHYVDVMCQLTGAKPVRVHGIGAALWADAAKQNYGHLHVTFDDGSVGWYEAGWGPMMSEEAFFVKDVVGPNGAVTIVPDQTAREGHRTLRFGQYRQAHQDRRDPPAPRQGRSGHKGVPGAGRNHEHGGRTGSPGIVRPRAGLFSQSHSGKSGPVGIHGRGRQQPAYRFGGRRKH